MTSFRHDDVPYFSQWSDPAFVRRIVEDGADPCDDASWTNHGFPDRATYRFWAPRVCGLACLESALAHWDVDASHRWELVEAALAHGAYEVRSDGSVRGLTYAPFLEWTERRFGVTGHVHADTTLDELVATVTHDQFAVASVSPEIRDPVGSPQLTGGHLVLVVGVDEQSVEFHNPSGVPPYQANARLSRDRFERYFAHRGFTMRRPPDHG